MTNSASHENLHDSDGGGKKKELRERELWPHEHQGYNCTLKQTENISWSNNRRAAPTSGTRTSSHTHTKESFALLVGRYPAALFFLPLTIFVRGCVCACLHQANQGPCPHLLAGVSQSRVCGASYVGTEETGLKHALGAKNILGSEEEDGKKDSLPPSEVGDCMTKLHIGSARADG